MGAKDYRKLIARDTMEMNLTERKVTSQDSLRTNKTVKGRRGTGGGGETRNRWWKVLFLPVLLYLIKRNQRGIL